MEYIADLHIHSPYSRATSKNCDVPGLFAWARVKGIHIVGTGDFTHPAWFARLKETLEPAEPGLFRLKDENTPPALANTETEAIPVRFMLSSEISCIYKKGDKTRKIHAVLYVPDMESVERINGRLAAIGNIESDGRPILGLDVKNLLEILLESSAEGFMVPAHIWTPWFSLFGSKSGFDAVEECFEDLTEHIFALETGLSSDPEMNRMISALDRYTLISNSDCHSPSKLGREANLFNTEFDYFALRDALKQKTPDGFRGTIEFYPEEGKYHYDGHRKCNVCLDPQETREKEGLCPVCGRPLTIGVMHRVMELADRDKPQYPDGQEYFESLVPLPEILGEMLQVGPTSKKVMEQYRRAISLFGSEFNLFRQVPIEEINRGYSPLLGEAVRRLRHGEVIRQPGFDGEFGVIRVFEQNEVHRFSGQMSFMPDNPVSDDPKPAPERQFRLEKSDCRNRKLQGTEVMPEGPNPEQQAAIQSRADKILVSAGPGTGKTFTLVSRIVNMVKEHQEPPDRFVIITFTNRAANEVRERLEKEIGENADRLFVGTFHGFCLELLRREISGLKVVGQDDRSMILKDLIPGISKQELGRIGEQIGRCFETGDSVAESIEYEDLKDHLDAYRQHLQERSAIDIDAIVPEVVNRLGDNLEFRKGVAKRVSHLFIDEFQDLNESQYRLIRVLAEEASVFAIGDPNQAIYGFRGSDSKYFFRFTREFQVETFALKRNYRSSSVILKAATAVIKNNSTAAESSLEPQKEESSKLEYHLHSTVSAEAEFIARKIDALVGGIRQLSIFEQTGNAETQGIDLGFRNIAVLYRLSDQAQEIARALDKAGIPYQLIGARPFFMTKELKPFYHWIRFTGANERDDFLQFLNYLPGTGKSTIQQLETTLPGQDEFRLHELSTSLFSAKIEGVLQDLKSSFLEFQKKTENSGIAEAVRGMMAFLKKDPTSGDSVRFLELCGIFGKNLPALSEHLYQNAQATIYDDRAEAVPLMTLHAAKGLEFPVVFIAGLEEQILPCDLPGLPGDLEEERRLFYVGLTRAQNKLFLTAAKNRTIFGKSFDQLESRFLKEIPKEILIRHYPQKPQPEISTGEQLSF